jgi:hypothetical protein
VKCDAVLHCVDIARASHGQKPAKKHHRNSGGMSDGKICAEHSLREKKNWLFTRVLRARFVASPCLHRRDAMKVYPELTSPE